MPTTAEAWGAAGLSNEGKLVAFDRRLLSRFRAATVHNRFGFQRSIPRLGGKAISWRRFEPVYPAGTAGSAANASAPAVLTEGTAPTAINATVSEIQATIAQYGQWALITDLAEEQSIDDIVPQYVELMGESMRDALDLVTRDIIVAGTNVQYASTAGSRNAVGSGMYLTMTELRKAKRTLKRNNARPIPSEGNKFVAIVHPQGMYDLEGDSTIQNIWQYAGERGDANQLFDVTFKDLPFGFRLYETTNARIFAASGASVTSAGYADVYATVVLGDEFYGTVKLDALPSKVIVKTRGSSGIADPLDQLSTVGWKAAHAAAILNQALGIRIEHVTSGGTQ